MTIDKEEDRERMGRLMEKAERVCLISRSLACPIALDAKIAVAEHAHA